MNLDTSLAQLETAQLVRRADDAETAFQFKHTLTQETVYQSLLRAQRREIHAHVAHVYEAAYPDRLDEFAALLAQHYGEAGDDAKTLEYATRAGDLAAQVYANTEAIALYTQALNLAKKQTNNTASLVSLYTRLGRAHELAGDYPHALEIYREMQTLARTRGDRTLELEALILQATAYAIGAGGVHDLPRAQEISTEALALAQELDDRKAQARIYWNLLLINRWGNEGLIKAIEYGEKSLALARELGLTEQIAFTLHDLVGTHLFITGSLELAEANIPESLALWRQLNNMPMFANALHHSAVLYFYEGNLDEAIRVSEEGYTLNQSIGNRYGVSTSGNFLWYVYRERGQMQQAVAMGEESVAIAEEMKIFGGQFATLVELGATFDWLGDYARATQYAQRGLDSLVPNSTMLHAIFPHAVLASVSLYQGNHAQAEEWLAPFSTGSFENYFQAIPIGATSFILTLIELALAQGDAPRALKIAEDAISAVRKMGMLIFPLSITPLKAKALRKLERADEAYALLNDARQQAETMQARYRLLPILFALIEMETERGNTAQAQLRRDEARALSQFIGDHTPLDLRESFLNLSEVRAVFTPA
jgi:tetratricopeptide (TPR) repeat protein